MDCSGFRARHLDFVDGTLDERSLVACERHRVECAACAQLDTRVRRGLLVCHNVALGGPTCDLTARVLAGVRADRRRREQQRAWRRAVGGWATVCAACAVAVVGVSRWMAPPTDVPEIADRAAAVPPALVPTVPVATLTTAGPAADERVVRGGPRVPVLGPIDSGVEILGDTFPPAFVAPPARGRAPLRRVTEAGFLSVSFTAP